MAFLGNTTYEFDHDAFAFPVTPSNEFDDLDKNYDDSTYNIRFDETTLLGGSATDGMRAGYMGNKRLEFDVPIHISVLLGVNGPTRPFISAGLKGLFYIAEDALNTPQAHPEVTCYRRNLFRVSGTIVISKTASHIFMGQVRTAIIGFKAVLSAIESIGGKPVALTSASSKVAHDEALVSSEGNWSTLQFEVKGESSPPPISINLSSDDFFNLGTNAPNITIPVIWDRLQFKYATANNGKRRGFQQHYRLQITLMGELQGHRSSIPLCQIQSKPIVVRGRSPNDFDASKDVPIPIVGEQKQNPIPSEQSMASMLSTSWIEPISQLPNYPETTQPATPLLLVHGSIIPDFPVSPLKRAHCESVAQFRKRQHTNCGPNDCGNEISSQILQVTTNSGDIDEENQVSVAFDLPSVSLGRLVTYDTATAAKATPMGTYEFIPLSLGESVPPVNAVWNPHDAHHFKEPTGREGQQLDHKPKRYYLCAKDDRKGEV